MFLGVIRSVDSNIWVQLYFQTGNTYLRVKKSCRKMAHGLAEPIEHQLMQKQIYCCSSVLAYHKLFCEPVTGFGAHTQGSVHGICGRPTATDSLVATMHRRQQRPRQLEQRTVHALEKMSIGSAEVGAKGALNSDCPESKPPLAASLCW